MHKLPYCKNRRFIDIEKHARRETGMTQTLIDKRDAWLRQAVKKAKSKVEERI